LFRAVMSESGISAQGQSKVLLLRSPTETGEDKYENAFKESEYEAITLSVLETVNVNIEEVTKLMGEGPQRAGVDGVIMTSGRSSLVWKDLAEELSSSDDTNRILEASGKTLHPQSKIQSSSFRSRIVERCAILRGWSLYCFAS
jgi:hypothetical protein